MSGFAGYLVDLDGLPKVQRLQPEISADDGSLPAGMEIAGYIYPADRRDLQKVTDREALRTWLREARGAFCGIWYQQDESSIHFFTDRLGWRALYYSEQNGLYWACRLRDMKQAGNLQVNRDAVEAFLQCGFLPGDMTWFEQVYRMPASALWTYHIPEKKWTRDRYWNWGEIDLKEISFEKAVDELVVQLRETIASGLPEEGSIGVSLSGGMDSRCLLALARERGAVCAYTFSDYLSKDVEIARRIAEEHGVDWEHLIIDSGHWMGGREEAIWRSEGMKGLLHLHHVPAAGVFSQKADWNLNGFLGGIALGGIYAGESGPKRRRSVARIELGDWERPFHRRIRSLQRTWKPGALISGLAGFHWKAFGNGIRLIGN